MEWLFDATSFMTRNHCGRWGSWLVTINQTANLLIFLAYFTIPLSLLSLWMTVKQSPELKKSMADSTWIVLMFVIFILSCGLTHLMDVLAFSWAPYRLFTFIDCVTAVASVPTAILLPLVLKRIYKAAVNEGHNQS